MNLCFLCFTMKNWVLDKIIKKKTKMKMVRYTVMECCLMAPTHAPHKLLK